MNENDISLGIIQGEDRLESAEPAISSLEIFNQAKIKNPEKASTPYIRAGNSTRQVMGNVLIALIPPSIAAAYFFGLRSIAVILVSVASAMISEIIWKSINKKKIDWDLSAAVTGVIFAHNLTANVPFYVPIIGSAFAIIIVKEVFGGIGANFMNPAAAARVFMTVLFVSKMNKFVEPSTMFFQTDIISSATPLASLKNHIYPRNAELVNSFFGGVSGTMGETSSILLLLGFAFLLFTKTINARITLSMIASVGIMAYVFGGFDGIASADYSIVIGHILSGGAIYGAVFMATDFATSPSLPAQQVFFGAGCGVFAMILRLWGSSSEGVRDSILLMNCLLPLIERLVPRRILGEKGAIKKEVIKNA